ncbi:MAG: PHP domain-containing protein [Nitrospiraceae bacterium]|nr:PHP domain-containing protein [Nitrospiraceae bacterium]
MAVSSEEFKAILSRRKYIFHVHTGYTDGSSTVGDYFEWAALHGYESIIFTEHARLNISYDFDAFLEDIRAAGRRFPRIRPLAGAEARLLPGGGLDISDDVSSKIQVICIACHSFPGDIRLYERSFEALLTNDKWDSHIRVWVHPGRFLRRLGLLDRNLENIGNLIRLGVNKGVFIENNVKDNLPPHSLLNGIHPDMIAVGCDAHCVDELGVLRA